MAHENHTGDESDVKITLMKTGGPLENGSDRPGEHLDAKGQGASQKFKKKNIAIGIGVVLTLGSLTGNIIQAVQIRKLQASPCPSDGSSHRWSQHGDWCYFFSDEQRNWDFSHSNCSSHGASLVTRVSEEERALIESKKDEFWIDIRREKADQPWKWPDGSSVTQFEVRNTGLCAYTNGEIVSSTDCDNIRHWICRKPVHAA